MIAKITKLKIIVPLEEKETALDILAQLNCFDFSTTKALSETKNKDLIDLLEKVAGFIKKNKSKSDNLSDKIYNFDPERLVANYKKYLELKNELHQIKINLQQIKKFKAIDINERQLPKLRYFSYYFGLIKSSSSELLFKKLKKIGFVYKLLSNKEDCLFYVIYQNSKKDMVEQIIKNFPVNHFEIKDKSPYHQYLELKKKLTKTQAQIKKIENFILSISKVNLMNKINELKYLEEIHAITSASKKSTYLIYLEGFSLKNKLQDLKRLFEKKIKYFYLIEEDFKPEEAPVYLENKKLVKPYEMITNLFSYPNYRETDPTPFLMPFFTIYFGFALSEAGYGFIMILLGLILLVIKKFKELSYLLILCGLSAIAFGFILGSLFGINIGRIDPQTNPVYVLKIALSLGIVHLALSYLMKAVNAFKKNDYLEAIKDGLIWAIILLTFSCWFIPSQVLNFQFLSMKTLTNLLIIELILLIGIYAFSSSSKIKGVFKGIFSLYSFVGIFSDTLSYSRLLALGLATGVIASTINLLAQLFMKMVPIFPLNYIILVFVLILGHSFNLIINLLGSFIHSSRLQFVESFSKFFEGGGKRFDVFCKPQLLKPESFKVITSKF